MVFLLGVLLITGFLEIGGFFEWAARHVVRRARSPRALLAAVVATSGLLSAFFVNDTICLVLTPLVIAALRPLGLAPLPFLLAIALGSNVGSAMTPMGNPQNMLIGVASGIPFAKFIASLALPSLGGLVIVFGVLSFVHRKELAKPFLAGADVPRAHFDGPLVKRSLLVFVGGARRLAVWILTAARCDHGGRDPARDRSAGSGEGVRKSGMVAAALLRRIVRRDARSSRPTADRARSRVRRERSCTAHRCTTRS